MDRGTSETTPLERNRPIKAPVKKVAAGIPAVISTIKHGLNNMGPLKSFITLNNVNKFSGFDCPGCAWPDPDNHRTIAEFCENGAKAVADEGTNKRADQEFWNKYSVKEISEKSDYWLNSQGRLTDPMILNENSDRYKKIGWNSAFELIADHLASMIEPNNAIFYTSGRTSNEAAFLWQLLARRVGTNNLPDCSNMCHESSGVALTESIGIGKGTVKLEDFEKSDLILVVGQNPGTNHPRMLTSLRNAKKKGASIISINPLFETGMNRFKHPQNPLEILGKGTKISDFHIPININGDMALFRGFAKVLIKDNRIDNEFIEKYTHGFDKYKKLVQDSDWNNICIHSGVNRKTIEKVGKIISKSNNMIICWAMGLTQHKNSVSTIQEITNLCLLGGHIGREGAGLCPVRGHSNVQGDRTVGINHKPSKFFLDKLFQHTGIDSPRDHGYDVVDSVNEMIKGNTDVFLSMGGNFISAMSDTSTTANAMRKCKLSVQISTKPNRSHIITGKTALILPCLGRTEVDYRKSGNQIITVENSMGVVHSSVGTNNPASNNLKSEVAIVTGIAKAFEEKILKRSDIQKDRWKSYLSFDWIQYSDNYDKIRDLIEKIIPGFDDYNAKCREKGGFYLPNPPRDNRIFNTKTDKANFKCNTISSFEKFLDSSFIMMTIRSHDQYNTTIYGMQDRYRGIDRGRRVVLINKEDMKDRGWNKYDRVDITSHFSGKKIHSKNWYIIPYDIPKGNVATYFPESNVLIPLDSVAEKSNTPTSKSVEVTLRLNNKL